MIVSKDLRPPHSNSQGPHNPSQPASVIASKPKGMNTSDSMKRFFNTISAFTIISAYVIKSKEHSRSTDGNAFSKSYSRFSAPRAYLLFGQSRRKSSASLIQALSADRKKV